MKKLLLALLSLLLCLTLVSCADFDLKAFVKRYLVDEEQVSRDPGYIESKENELYEYEVYEDHILLVAYIGEETEVIIPTTIESKPVTVIGALCFYYTDGVTSVTLPEGIKRLDQSAFYHCEELTSISLPSTLTTIGERCFAWCTSLTSIALPSGITEIPDYCFNYCTSLLSLVIPSGCTAIGDRAFSWCESLAEITIPSGVKNIGDYCFYKCSLLSRLYATANLEELGASVFDDCLSLSVIAPAASRCATYCAQNSIPCYTSEAYIPLPDESEVSE